MAVLWLMVPNEYDLRSVLPAVVGFTDSARAGALPPATAAAFPFLDRSPAAADAVYGGFFMAPDYVKYAFPTSSAMTLLAWSLVQFSSGYGPQLPAALGQLRWGADYLMRAHTNATAFVVQVGDARDSLPLDPSRDRGGWGRPANMPPSRKLFVLTPGSKGGADAVAAASAALAATYQVFKARDPAYAASALRHAQELYGLATLLPTNTTYCAEVWCGGPGWLRFASSSVFDDLSLAASWLYVSTGVRRYAAEAELFYRQHRSLEVAAPRPPLAYAPSYDNAAWSAAMLLAQLTDSPLAKSDLLDFFRGWMSGSDSAGRPVLLVTPRGLPFLGPTPLPTAATAGLMALIYATATRPAGSLEQHIVTNLECFALQGVTYALGGALGRGRSFVVGVGAEPPRRPTHPQASCPGGGDAVAADGTTVTTLGGALEQQRCDVSAAAAAGPNPHVITGALVAGPDAQDGYEDARLSPQSAVSPLHNIALAGVMAGLLERGVVPAACQRGQGLYQRTFLAYVPTA